MSDENCPKCGSPYSYDWIGEHDGCRYIAYVCGGASMVGTSDDALIGKEGLRRQRDRRQAIVDKLPKTVDKVVILPGAHIWDGNGDEWLVTEIGSLPPDTKPGHYWQEAIDGGWTVHAKPHRRSGKFSPHAEGVRWWICYSTAEAARTSNDD